MALNGIPLRECVRYSHPIKITKRRWIQSKANITVGRSAILKAKVVAPLI
jgi:hypothetical protein